MDYLLIYALKKELRSYTLDANVYTSAEKDTLKGVGDYFMNFLDLLEAALSEGYEIDSFKRVACAVVNDAIAGMEAE